MQHADSQDATKLERAHHWKVTYQCACECMHSLSDKGKCPLNSDSHKAVHMVASCDRAPKSKCYLSIKTKAMTTKPTIGIILEASAANQHMLGMPIFMCLGM